MTDSIDDAPRNRGSVFWVGVLAMFTAGSSASIRAATAGNLKAEFLDKIDLARSGAMVGETLGISFLAFSLTLAVTSTLLDKIGMKTMLLIAALCMIVSCGLIAFCGSLAQGPAVYQVLLVGSFLSGVAWGAVEGTTNPLTATLYPDDTTHRMNVLHAWWPAGLIAGGLVGFFGGQAHIDWRLLLAPLPILAVVFGVLALTISFPPTRTKRMGVPLAEQFREFVRRPSFFIWFVLMLFTAATELAPQQWVDVALSNVVGMRGILLLVYVAGIQFVGRHFAGPLAHRFSAEGLLCGSSVLAAIGLYGLGLANSPATAIAAATLWGLGVCYLWPTMIATAAERYPRGGALTIGLMGISGSLSAYFVLPKLGAIYDQAKLQMAGSAQALATMTPEQMKPVLVYAAGQSFKVVSIIPALLVVAFGVLLFLGRKGPKTHGAAGEAPSAL